MFLLHWRRVAVAALRSNRSNPDFAVARYGTNGAPDASFGSGGKLTIDHVLPLQQKHRRTLGGVRATIGAILRAITAEHTLALRAATKAASPRQSLAEVRAMYVPSEPHQHGTKPGGQKRENMPT